MDSSASGQTVKPKRKGSGVEQDPPHWMVFVLMGIPVFFGGVLFVIAILKLGPLLLHELTPTGELVGVGDLNPAGGLRLPETIRERLAAQREHRAIKDVADACLAQRSNDQRPTATERLVTLAEKPATAGLPGYLGAELYLSDAISNARIEMAGKAVIDGVVANLFQWTIVLTGLFTTVFITVKSVIVRTSVCYFPLAVMAILFSAFGTGTATLNSFYTPRIEHQRTETALASLRDLHWTLASEVLRERDPCGEKGTWTEWRPRHMRDLTHRFSTIMATSARPVTNSAEDGPEPSDEKDQGLDRRSTSFR